jgi:hypothetical protein
MICADADGIRVVRYWRHRFEPSPDDAGEDYYAGKLSALMVEAVERRTRDPGTMVVPISGGYDSRALLACLRRITDAPLRTVSWGTNETTEDADARIGQRVASRIGADHRFLRRDPDTLPTDFAGMFERFDGLTDDAVFHHGELGLMQRIRYEIGGEYLVRGDECFGFGGTAVTDLEALRRIAVYDLAHVPAVLAILESRARAEFIQLSARAIDEVRADSTAVHPLDRKDDFYFSQRLFHYLNRSSYYKLTVLELQNPWLDRRILEFVGGLPRQYRIDKALFKRVVHAMFPELHDIPYARRHSLEDWGIALRKSRTLQSFLHRQLLEHENGLDEIIDRNAVKARLSSFESGTTAVHRPRASDLARRTLARAPWLYRIAKRLASKHLPVRDIDPAMVLLRLVVVRRWYDEFDLT